MKEFYFFISHKRFRATPAPASSLKYSITSPRAWSNCSLDSIHVSRNIQPTFHYTKHSGLLGWNWNGNVRFDLFWPEYLGSLLEVVHLDRPGRNFPVAFWQTGFLPYLSSVDFTCGRLGKGLENGQCNSLRLARFVRKILFHFSSVSPSGRLVWYNGMHSPVSKRHLMHQTRHSPSPGRTLSLLCHWSQLSPLQTCRVREPASRSVWCLLSGQCWIQSSL